MVELRGSIPHNIHVDGEGGCGRAAVVAGRHTRAERAEAGTFERGDEVCPGLGKEVTAMDDEDGGFGEAHGCLR